MHAVGLELVDNVYSAISDPSAALPTVPRWNIVIQMTKLIYVNFISIIPYGECQSILTYILRWNDPKVVVDLYLMHNCDGNFCQYIVHVYQLLT